MAYGKRKSEYVACHGKRARRPAGGGGGLFERDNERDGLGAGTAEARSGQGAGGRARGDVHGGVSGWWWGAKQRAS